jgi:hypothetical protein
MHSPFDYIVAVTGLITALATLIERLHHRR